MPANKTTSTEKRAQPARKRAPASATATRTRTRRRKPTHAEISERAYFIALRDGGADEFGNWLRAERELTAA